MSQQASKKRKAIFAGTPEFAVPALDALVAHDQFDVVAVYTQPDRGAGRGRKEKPSAVKLYAQDHGLTVQQPVGLRDVDQQQIFKDFGAELLVVAAYGLILPRSILDHCFGINVHASLLPRWRGAAPIQRAIMAGDTHTGITMMRVVEALDAGPILLQKTCPIEVDDTGGSLHDKLAELGRESTRLALDQYCAGALEPTPQNDANAVYAEKITSADRPLDWTTSATLLERQVRALNPVPVATMTIKDITVKVWRAHAVDASSTVTPGAVVSYSPQGINIACADGCLCITELQPQGKRRMSAAEFINGSTKLLGSD